VITKNKGPIRNPDLAASRAKQKRSRFVFSLGYILLANYCYLYDISVTSVNLFANDVKETEGYVYIASLMTLNTNIIMLTALRFQT
jgi:hypothetical protein